MICPNPLGKFKMNFPSPLRFFQIKTYVPNTFGNSKNNLSEPVLKVSSATRFDDFLPLWKNVKHHLQLFGKIFNLFW